MPSGYTSISFTVKSVSRASDETYSVTPIVPLTSSPSSNDSVVYTSTSSRPASTSRWSNAPASIAPPVQHTLPPHDTTGSIGS